jgi:hypothetical protein
MLGGDAGDATRQRGVVPDLSSEELSPSKARKHGISPMRIAWKTAHLGGAPALGP